VGKSRLEKFMQDAEYGACQISPRTVQNRAELQPRV